MSPVLAKRSNGSDILIVQQKSGMAYAVDPDKEGALVWQYKTSDGSGLGGQWGAATDGRQVYFSVNGPPRIGRWHARRQPRHRRPDLDEGR